MKHGCREAYSGKLLGKGFQREIFPITVLWQMGRCTYDNRECAAAMLLWISTYPILAE